MKSAYKRGEQSSGPDSIAEDEEGCLENSFQNVAALYPLRLCILGTRFCIQK